MAKANKSVSPRTSSREGKVLEERISRINECHTLGLKILKACDRYSEPGKLASVAAENGINREQAAKYRAFATPKTGYSEQELNASIRAFRIRKRSLTIGHFIRLLTVPKKKERKELEKQALDNQWSLRRLQLEILAQCGRRYEAAGRKPRIPDDSKSAIGSLAHQVWSWRHWLEAFLEAEVSSENAELEAKLKKLSSQMLKVYESIQPNTEVEGVRKKKANK